MTDTTYNGWKNRETWNVALWLQNDEALYNIARKYDSYDRLYPRLIRTFGAKTPDGVLWGDNSLDSKELDSMLSELG